MDDITTLHNVGLAFLSELSGSLDWTHGFPTFTEIMEILVCNNFSFNKATFEITVNDTSCLRSQRTLLDDPAADFFLASWKN
jgi:hypothetical protein